MAEPGLEIADDQDDMRVPESFGSALQREDQLTKAFLRIRLPYCRCRSCCVRCRCSCIQVKDFHLDLTNKFADDAVLTRMMIWGDVAIAWGPVMPAISIAGLLYIYIEAWCHEVACAEFGRRPEGGDVCASRRYFLIGLLVSWVLHIIHVVSTVETTPMVFLLFAVVGVSSMFGTAGFYYYSWCQRSGEPNGQGDAGIELSQAR